MTVVDGWTARSGVRIHYLDNAPAEPVGLPILFSPGFSDMASEYTELLEFFSPRRILVVEVRGRGSSDAPDSGYLAADQAADLQAVLAEAGVDRFHLMTFSRGTTWGLDTAIALAERVVSVSIGDYRPREIALDSSHVEQFLGNRFRGKPMIERMTERAIRGVMLSSVARDLTSAVAALGVPMLVATGTEPDCLLGEAGLAEYRDAFPGIETLVVDGAGHDLFRRDRLAYARAVAEFVTRAESA